jgi:hypothetical protein
MANGVAHPIQIPSGRNRSVKSQRVGPRDMAWRLVMEYLSMLSAVTTICIDIFGLHWEAT